MTIPIQRDLRCTRERAYLVGGAMGLLDDLENPVPGFGADPFFVVQHNGDAGDTHRGPVPVVSSGAAFGGF